MRSTPGYDVGKAEGAGMTPEQGREVQTWDTDSRMAYDELAACFEFEQGLSRDAAELRAFTVTR